MDVKEAVKAAKTYVADVYADEHVLNVGLEGIEHDDARGEWKVTLGFSRPWEKTNDIMALAMGREETNANTRRSYYVVTIKESNGKVISIRRNDIQE